MNALFFLTEAAPGGGGTWITMIVLLVVMVAMFFFTSRSNKKQEKQAQDMRDSLSVGDEITTIGGIIGKIVSIKEETLVLETTKAGTKIRFLKGAIRSVDVKAADLAAQVMETQTAEAAPAEETAPAEEKTEKKSKKK